MLMNNWKEYLTKHQAAQCLVGTEFLLKLAEQIRPITYLETGCAHLATFAVYSSLLPSNGLAIGIDIKKYYEWNAYSSQVRTELLRGTLEEKQTRDLLAKTLQGSKIDIAFIDGNHEYCGVKADWEAIKPHLRSGSLVIFHDYDPVAVFRDGHKEGQGAAILCEELRLAGHPINSVPVTSIGTAYMIYP